MYVGALKVQDNAGEEKSCYELVPSNKRPNCPIGVLSSFSGGPGDEKRAPNCAELG